ACAGRTAKRSAASTSLMRPRAVRYSVDGIVSVDDGAPGTRLLPVAAAASSTTVSTMPMRMAPFGHACTHAGASPSASRPWHLAHLRTMPRWRLYVGTSYGQVNVQ